LKFLLIVDKKQIPYFVYGDLRDKDSAVRKKRKTQEENDQLVKELELWLLVFLQWFQERRERERSERLGKLGLFHFAFIMILSKNKNKSKKSTH
jgi:hypothetical protein